MTSIFRYGGIFVCTIFIESSRELYVMKLVATVLPLLLPIALKQTPLECHKQEVGVATPVEALMVASFF